MQEASKTNQIRGKEFLEKYLRGMVIDIGCGNDLVVDHAEPFDIEHGNAQQISRYRQHASYDCVHSSHCLEHMTDVREAISQWWGLVKPGGYLIIVVPHEDLYEQGIFPSWFNADHKATFRTEGDESWSPRSFNLRSLAAGLDNADIVSLQIHDQGYDYSLQKHGAPRWMWYPFRLKQILLWKLTRRFTKGKKNMTYARILDSMFSILGVPIDQTVRGAMAQIQVVIKRMK